ncbi:MAG: hypothetical protein ACRCXB_27865 [Aeromonadaceae bacterium]
MQAMESASLSVAVALALVVLARVRDSGPAYVAGFFFVFCAALNQVTYTNGEYTADAVEIYFLGAVGNIILMVMLVTDRRISIETLIMAACLAILSAQYVIMAIDEYQNNDVETWLWSWSYQFRASADVIIASLGVISAMRSKGH